MKLKGILTKLGLLILVLLAISFFLPKDMNLSVTKQLEASPEQVFSQVNDLKNWENWSPWNDLDPDMEITYGESHIGEGASYAYKSDKKGVGNGAVIIGESVPNQKVVTLLKFEGYEENDNRATFNIEPQGEGSNVTWDFNSDYSTSWPWARYGMAFGKMMLNKAYKKGLTSIDSYVAENPEAHLKEADDDGTTELAIVEKEVESFNGVAVVRTGTFQDMFEKGEQIYGEAFGEVGKLIGEQGLTMSGMPFSQANKWDEENETFEIEIGIPVAEGGKQYGGGKVVMASYYGPYHGVAVAYEAIDAYCQDKGLEMRGAPWEIYANDPGEVPDTSKWLTEVYFPVN